MKYRAKYVLILALAIAPAASAQRGAQPRVCQLVWDNLPSTSHTNSLKTASGKIAWWIGGGFRARCLGTNMVISSDSAEYSQDARVMTLVGNARYREDSTSIDANTMRYTELDQRVIAEGNVKARMRSGTTIDAAIVNYLRPQGRARPFAIIDAYGRSHLVLRDSVKMTDSAATKIDADHMHMERDSIVNAGGRVIILRPDLKATSDSAETNTGKGTARLIGGSPRIEGLGTRTFRVDGRMIDIFGRGRRVDSVHALGRAVAVSDSLTLVSDTLHLQTTGTLIERVIAWGPGRARAISPERDIIAQRIEILMPRQRLREVFAVGRARAETKADSLVKSKERDWIEGDTLNALFDQSVTADTSKQPPITEIRARGNARSYYQVPSKEQRDSLPTLNYVTGKRIIVAFRSGDVHDVRVTGDVRGINLAPQAQRDTTQAKKAPAKGGTR